MTLHRYNFERMMLVVIFTTFMGQIYMQPFGSGFRLTFAVVVLNLLLLTVDEIRPFLTINLVGLFMFFTRSALYILSSQGSWVEAFEVYYPVLFFYLFFSLFFMMLDVRRLTKNPLGLFLAIWICDTIPNIAEVIVRQEWNRTNFESVVYIIIIIAIIRTFVAIILFYLIQYFLEKSKSRESHKQFVEKILLASNLKTELFFLKKSKKDIEDALRRSYLIYEQIEEPSLKDSVLMVTKDINEIKKDYARVIAGIEKNIGDTPAFDMSIKEIVDIVIIANKRVAMEQGIEVAFHTAIDFDLNTNDYLGLVSILNNIVNNAIESFDTSGEVRLAQHLQSNQMIIVVTNNGKPIPEQDIPFIFEAGFSTKFENQSNVMATGIGLTHVKRLVEDYYKGTIDLCSEIMRETCFRISIPLENIQAKSDEK